LNLAVALKSFVSRAPEKFKLFKPFKLLESFAAHRPRGRFERAAEAIPVIERTLTYLLGCLRIRHERLAGPRQRLLRLAHALICPGFLAPPVE
jgi:hypothetical protein